MRNCWLTLILSSLLATTLGCGGCDDDGGGGDGVDSGTDADSGMVVTDCFTHAVIAGGGDGSPPPDGLGGEGDLEVTTDVLRAVFAAVDRPVGVAASGGTLMDLHLLGQSDHLNELSQLAGVSQGVQIAYTEMAVIEESDHLAVEVRGHVQPQPVEAGEDLSVTPDPGTDLEVVTRYEFRCGEPQVWLDTTLTNTNEGDQTYSTDPAFAVMDVMFWGERSLRPFCPDTGQGDACTPFDIDNPLAGLVETLYVGSTGSVIGDPGTFAFYLDDPEVDTFIGVHDDQVSAFGFFNILAGDMEPGDTRSARRAVVVGGGADAASATDVALEELAEAGRYEIGTVTGTVATTGGETISEDPYQRPMVVLAAPGADPVDPDAWTPHTMVRVGEDGSFSAKVPAGDVSWELRAPGHLPKRGEGGTLEAEGTLDLGTVELDALPLLEVQVRDITSGSPEPLPSRLSIVGADGTESPTFGPHYGGSPAGGTVLTDGMGEAAVRLPPGTYDVYATHGPAYTLALEQVTIEAGSDESLSLDLEELPVFPEGFITADFHVHSGASYDSSVPIDDRVRAFLAEGVQAMVSTEHDVIFDYGPALEAVEATMPLAWQGRVRTFVGLESTATIPQEDYPHTIGHHNSFPLTPVIGAHKNGAPNDEYVDLGTLYDRLRAAPSPVDSPLVQLNHARGTRYGTVWLGYFDTCAFDPAVALDPGGACFGATGPSGESPLDQMDAMEVINGPDAITHIHMSRDWHSLVRQAAVPPVATANSDTHTLTAAPGYPLTVLRTDTALDELDDGALVEAVRSGSVAGSLGVFTWVTARERGGTVSVAPGRTALEAPSGELIVDLRVAAAPWVPVEEIRIRVDGVVVERLSAAEGDWTEPTDPFGTDGVIRFEGEVDLSAVPLAEDGFITVEAGFALPMVADLDGDGLVDATDNDGDGDVDTADLDAGGIVLGDPPEHLGVLARGARPMSFTNPIYVNVVGPMYEPPGTPLP